MRPAMYDDPAFTVPPAEGGSAPDYPLAAAFISADSSNYTNGGISSYQYVVVHTMQGYYGGSISWFQNPSANVSAHYCMRAEDGEITQMVHDDDRAWHVGNSNPYAIGIEHEGFVNDASWYTWATYQSSARLARWLCDTYGIPVDRDHIVGHVELPNQTHTDPGPNWNWDLYMALVHDVVSQGRIEGVVVDASNPCIVTTAADTWLKASLQSADALEEHEKCFVPAGTELAVQWRSNEMIGQVRLTLDQAPCSGDLATTAFVPVADLTGLCTPAELGLPNASVTVDGMQTKTDDEGRFWIDGLGAGSWMIDTTLDGFVSDAVPVMLDVYPGARVVIALEPTATPSDDGGTDPDPADSGSDPDPDAGPGGDPPPSDDEGSDGADPDDDDGVVGALPDTYGGGGDSGSCACVAGSGAQPAIGFGLWVVAAITRRRAKR